MSDNKKGGAEFYQESIDNKHIEIGVIIDSCTEEIQKDKKLEGVKTSILSSVFHILNNNILSQESTSALLLKFGFDIDKHIELYDEVVANEKIILKYRLNQHGEEIIKNILTYIQFKKLIQEKLQEGYDFSKLNKTIQYHNSQTGENVNGIETGEDFEKLLGKYQEDPRKFTLIKVEEAVKGLKKISSYKDRLQKIFDLLNTENFLNQSILNNLGNQSQFRSDYFTLFSAAQNSVKQNYQAIEETTEIDNLEYIQEKQEKEEAKSALLDQKMLLDNENLKQLQQEQKRATRKEIGRKIGNAIFASSLFIGGLYGISQVSGQKDTQESTENQSMESLIAKNQLQYNQTIKTAIGIEIRKLKYKYKHTDRMKFYIYNYIKDFLARVINDDVKLSHISKIQIIDKGENKLNITFQYQDHIFKTLYNFDEIFLIDNYNKTNSVDYNRIENIQKITLEQQVVTLKNTYNNSYNTTIIISELTEIINNILQTYHPNDFNDYSLIFDEIERQNGEKVIFLSIINTNTDINYFHTIKLTGGFSPAKPHNSFHL